MDVGQGITPVLLSAVLLFALFCLNSVIRWRLYIWLPDYLARFLIRRDNPATTPVHVVFLFVDHYEPGWGDEGAMRNRGWLDNYRKLADGHADSYGRKPQHSWFYPYDHGNAAVMSDLSRAVYDGYGEVELHWHHQHDNNKNFPGRLRAGIAWFNTFGALVSENGTISFGFIHGNWSLDNAKGEEFCGVSRELEILKQEGCYADFTFPALGDLSQPAKVNSIYYAADDDKPKSYNRGVDAEVGKRNNQDLMIFEGPISFKDYSAIESFNIPTPRKIDSWIRQRITVKGRPEWIFVKVFTHGIQSETIFYGNEVSDTFAYLESRYSTGDYRLHYVTAREAYNIVRAAEDGQVGDPDDYRDYAIAQPVNKLSTAFEPAPLSSAQNQATVC